MRKIDKTILFVIFGSVPIGLLIYLLYNIMSGPTLKQTILERDSLETVNSVVDSLFTDDRNHDVKTAILHNGQFFQIVPEWESQIGVGDSLHKKKGSFLLEVHNKDARKNKVLDYRNTIRPDL